MKDFDLNVVMEGNKVRTRDGREVISLATVGLGQIEFPIVAAVKGLDCPVCYRVNGRYGESCNHGLDLVMVYDKCRILTEDSEVFVITASGLVVRRKAGEDMEVTRAMDEVGNVFWSREEALEEVERRKVKVRLDKVLREKEDE